MSVSIQMVRFFAEVVERVGVSRDQLLTSAGLDPEILADHDARLSLADYDRVVRAALALSRDEALGLHLLERSRFGTSHLLGHLASHVTTLRQAIETATRYQGILSDQPKSTLCEQDDIASVRYAFPPVDAPMVRFAAELAMSGFLHLIQRFVGPNAQPRGVFFGYRAPSYHAEYTRVFGGTERFGHAFTGIEFERAWLDRTQLHQNPELYAVLREQAERALGRLVRDENLAQVVKAQLASCDPSQMLTMEEMARLLSMSARTLRRRLVAEGVEYKDMIKQARIGKAKRLLENPRISIQEAAYAMGYATPAAFHRAFKRWTGMTPKEYKSSY